jgi:hypothetical protein
MTITLPVMGGEPGPPLGHSFLKSGHPTQLHPKNSLPKQFS